MGIPIREHTVEQIESRLDSMNTGLNKINYLESAVNITGFGIEIKKFLWDKLSELYAEKRMYERAAKSMANKAGLEVFARDKINSYINSAELYSVAGKVEESDNMFLKAIRNVAPHDKAKVILARKNIYLKMAGELEGKGRKASAVKFYEKLLKMNLENFEKNKIKNKLVETYKSLGMFREAKLLEGL